MLRRVLIFLAVLIIPLSLVSVTALPARADESPPTLSPAQGPPGTAVTASATDWSGCSSMSVTGWGETLGTTSISDAGAFSLPFTVPSSAPLGATQLQFDPICTHSTYIPFVTFTVTEGTPGTSAPVAPSNLTVTAVDPHDIRLNWQDNSSNEAGFEINNGVISMNSGAGSTSYNWGGLAPRTYMCFRIRAYNSAGDSAWDPNVSPWYVCTTTPNTPTPQVFTWGDYLTYVQQYYADLAGANESLECISKGSAGSFTGLIAGCLSLAWKNASPILRAVFSAAFDVLKCFAAARTGSEGAIAACISFSGGELLIKFVHAALNAVPAGRAFLDQPFPVQP
jgi:hypothetical protein